MNNNENTHGSGSLGMNPSSMSEDMKKAWLRLYSNEDIDGNVELTKLEREELKVRRKLLMRALDMSIRMRLLRERIEVVYKEIQEFERVTEEEIGGMSDSERERYRARGLELMRLMDVEEENFRKLDREYRELRVEVNDVYGKEIMKELGDIGDLGKDKLDAAEEFGNMFGNNKGKKKDSDVWRDSDGDDADWWKSV